MTQPFSPDISLILGLQSCGETCLESAEERDNFTDKRSFACSSLQGWGLNLGEMFWSPDNMVTLNSVLELISWRQKETAHRARAKEDLIQMQFEKEKYRSLLEQTKRALEDKNKVLGRVENELHQLKASVKGAQQTVKREREEEKKVIVGLRNRGEAAAVEIKKKEQEINRMKEQMKRSIGEKSIAVKNSFEVMQLIEQTNYTSINNTNLHYKELINLKKEHATLRDKLFQIREEIVQFAQGIQRELYGEDEETIARKYKTMFPVNHNLLFRKECIVKELRQFFRDLKRNIILVKSPHKIQVKRDAQGKREAQMKKSERILQMSPRSMNQIKSPKSMMKIKHSTSKVIPQTVEVMPQSIEFFDRELSQCSESSIISFIDPVDAHKKGIYDRMGDILFPTG